MAQVQPRRVAVVGAGPAGLFAAQHLVSQDKLPVMVDVFDRLPTPFGLLRYGVAPDHTSIKSVATALARTFESPLVRFLGHVEMGVDVEREQLLEAYDAVVYAVGAADDLLMGVPGEALLGSGSARQFVAWYGGHPDAVSHSLRGIRSVACIGVGNVAVDVARILAKEARTLRHTDMPEGVLSELEDSDVTDIWIIGRRGPTHASFTTRELRDLLATPGLDVVVEPGAFDDVDESGLDRRTRANLAALRAVGERVPGEVPVARRTLHFLFWHQPVEIRGGDKVAELVLEHKVYDKHGKLVPSGARRSISVDQVFRAIGYQGVALPGVPFDPERGIVPNEAGRVLGVDGGPSPGEYVAGWIKRGAVGVIGTNKSDAAETVANLLADLPDLPRRDADPLEKLHVEGVEPTTFDDWLAIDSAEVELGRSQDRPRVKIETWDELMQLVDQERRAGTAVPTAD